jgi:hypothetical protein
MRNDKSRFREWFDDINWNPFVLIGIIASIVLGIAWLVAWDSKKTNSLHEKYISFCVKDSTTEFPGMAQSEIIERCEVAWKMERKSNEDKSVIIFMPSYR